MSRDRAPSSYPPCSVEAHEPKPYPLVRHTLRAPKPQPAQCLASQQRVCRSAWPAATVPLASWDGSKSGLDSARVCCMNRCRPSEVGWCGGAFPVTVWVSAVPFNVNAVRRHHIPSQRHRATNSAAFDAARCAGPQDPDPQHREAGHSSSAARLRSRAPAGGQVLAQVAHRCECRHRVDRGDRADHRRRGRRLARLGLCSISWMAVASFTADGAYDQTIRTVSMARSSRVPRGVRHRATTLRRRAERHSAHAARLASVTIKPPPHGRSTIAVN
jgi:hypothetical protein